MGGYKMIDNKQKQQVYEILITPIECTEYSKGIPKIRKEGFIIKSTQTYYPYKSWNGKPKAIPLDEDMSDFSVTFYEIMYKDLLDNTPIMKNDDFYDKSFAGDTMNSFNSVANLITEAGNTSQNRTTIDQWPAYLKDYYKQYHCLANFWILPMEIGRTLKNAWSKGNFDNGIQDYMDRFLKRLKENLSQYSSLYPGYFKKIKGIEDFTKVHNLVGSYVYGDMGICEFSINNSDGKNIIKIVQDRIKLRATVLAESDYAEALWNYFNELGLF